MRVAVIGGGLFGATAASVLASSGHQVSLFERSPDILRGASGVNQLRLHRGYHYPRSASTVRETLRAEALFLERYGEAIVTELSHYYVIARESRTAPDDYLAVCDEFGLTYSIEPIPRVFGPGSVDLCLRVPEASLDAGRLRDLCWRSLVVHGVEVLLSRTFLPEDGEFFDHLVVAGYASNSKLLQALECQAPRYHYKMCELVVAALPPWFRDKSFVIMDGPFPSFDPLARTGLHLMGHVVAMHHTENVGVEPRIPDRLAALMDGQWHAPRTDTVFPAIVDATARFLPDVAAARHVASMFTVRAVLPDVPDSDQRPTLIATDGHVSSIFGGKLTTCVSAARELDALLR
jgi:hypothetical protein